MRTTPPPGRAMIGQTLGHYRILEHIGAGGMGVVYRAHDESLDRDVALKVLPAGMLSDESARKRFKKEALALAKLNHPNVEAVYEFNTQDGTDFLVMEYIPGVTLSDKLAGGPLPEKEVLRVGAQLAEGLAAAHEQNIIHRDLKPGNLRIMPDGRLKILDFGLAKLVRPLSEADLTASVSETHAVTGTLPYMAPEQLQGAPVDARTDIYAAGTVLYEMATGQLPFQEKLSTSLADAILHRPAPPPGRLKTDLSSRLEEIILKCMEKEPDNRYQSAKDLLVDLRRLSSHEVPRVAPRRDGSLQTPIGALVGVLALLIFAAAGYFTWRHFWPSAKPPVGKIMLAVLPFENLSGDPEQEYFSDGLTEEMIAQLGSLQPRRLGVIARTSAMKYKKTEKSVEQIGQELHVAYVLEGSVRKAGMRVRVTAQLIQVSDQTHLWAENYEKGLADVLSVQSEVAQRIARSLELELLPGSENHLATDRPVKPEAYEAYLKGRYHWYRRGPDDVRKATQYFQTATELDPTYALAYAGLADSYALYPFYGVLTPRESFPQARSAAAKALELDRTLVEAHTAMAFITFYYDWNWAAAEVQLKNILEMRPDYAIARQWHAEYLYSMGRSDEAIREIKRAEESDPLSSLMKAMEGYVYYYSHQYDQAIEACRRALAFDPNYGVTHVTLGLAYEQKGFYKEAIGAYQKSAELRGRNFGDTLRAPRLDARLGRRGDAKKELDRILRMHAELQRLQPKEIASVYVALGDNDEAIAWLAKAYEERDVRLVELKVDPLFDPLRSDPRFQGLLRRMNFPQN